LKNLDRFEALVFPRALDEKKIRRRIAEDNFFLSDRFHTKMITQK
jgi:hypothetical protein